MLVLGISPLDKDSTVSLVSDGKVLFAAGEDRFTRVKLQDGFPHRALEAALKYAGVSKEEIDRVAYPFFDWQKEAAMFTKNIEEESRFLRKTHLEKWVESTCAALDDVPLRSEVVPGLDRANEVISKPWPYKLFYRLAGSGGPLSRLAARTASHSWMRGARTGHEHWQKDLEGSLSGLGLLGKLKRYDHHSAHAAAAYFTSGYDRALVITLDQ